jgi:hypothetical protein
MRPGGHGWRMGRGYPAWREAWLITEELLDRMNREAMSSGARLVVAIVSMTPQVYPDIASRRRIERRFGVQDLLYANRGLVGIGQKLDFPVISLAEPLTVRQRQLRVTPKALTFNTEAPWRPRVNVREHRVHLL